MPVFSRAPYRRGAIFTDRSPYAQQTIGDEQRAQHFSQLSDQCRMPSAKTGFNRIK
jgi:hypothetical protein